MKKILIVFLIGISGTSLAQHPLTNYSLVKEGGMHYIGSQTNRKVLDTTVLIKGMVKDSRGVYTHKHVNLSDTAHYYTRWEIDGIYIDVDTKQRYNYYSK